MFSLKSRSKQLSSRKIEALSMFYSAKEKLSKLMADQSSYLFQLEENIFEMKRESDLIESEISQTSKMIEKIDDFLSL